jgi:5'-AMP-activated protein kinase catalytic alpha subunit
MCHKNIYEGGSERPRKMVLVESIGKYRVGRTIGEGSFAKVKLAVDTDTGGTVAVKVIDRSTVLRNNLMYQVRP